MQNHKSTIKIDPGRSRSSEFHESRAMIPGKLLRPLKCYVRIPHISYLIEFPPKKQSNYTKFTLEKLSLADIFRIASKGPWMISIDNVM